MQAAHCGHIEGVQTPLNKLKELKDDSN
jgi:hypothetical protein